MSFQITDDGVEAPLEAAPRRDEEYLLTCAASARFPPPDLILTASSEEEVCLFVESQDVGIEDRQCILEL